MIQLTTIKVRELPDFVSGSIWQNLSPKPITVLRAISQFHNPRANPEDLALIFASENDQLLGLVGLLPDYIHGEPDFPVSSNTCWWVDPVKGRQLAVPLFLKAFEECSQRMFMTDCTPHTMGILQKTNLFDFPETNTGIRGFLKFNLHEIVPQKLPWLQRLIPAWKTADAFLNLLLLFYRKFFLSEFLKKQFTTEFVNTLDDELHRFIKNHSVNELIRCSGTDLEWILQFPWISQKLIKSDEEPINYPFSYIVRSFEQYFLKILEKGETVGFIMISIRDGHMKVPYVYFEKENIRLVLQVIYQQALLKNAVTLTIFHPELTEKMKAGKHPFIFRKKIRRLMAISKSLAGNYQKYHLVQDGDGDVVFT